MPVEITDADEISRCIVYDRAFDHSLHVDEFLWRFENTQSDGASHESGVLRRLAPDAEDVHRIGCGIAANQNERKNNPPPGQGRRYYCGFRTASYASLPTTGNGYYITITNVPENGEESHVDVALTVTVEGKNAKAVRRTDAGIALAEQFGPPAAHRCDCDVGDDQHPFALWGPECLVSGLRDRWPDLVLEIPSNDDGELDDQQGNLLP